MEGINRLRTGTTHRARVGFVEPWIPASLVAAVAAFTAEMRRAEHQLADRRLDDALTQPRVNAACDALDAALRQLEPSDPAVLERLSGYLFRETFADFSRSANVERWLTKPRGYAGDYYTIELMYREQPEGDGRLGRCLDRWALDLPAVRAVRNRRGLLADTIRAVARATDGEPALVTSLASGPARELFDVLGEADAPPILATCVDVDEEAIAFASDRARTLGVADRLTFSRDNVLRLSRGAGRTSLAPQHLIYSVGLIDYLKDTHVVRLLDWIHDHLRPGGTVVLGNFDVVNPTRPFMDHIFQWRLIHRTADDLRALFAQSKFGDASVDVRAEAEGINLFAFCTRPSGQVAGGSYPIHFRAATDVEVATPMLECA